MIKQFMLMAGGYVHKDTPWSRNKKLPVGELRDDVKEDISRMAKLLIADGRVPDLIWHSSTPGATKTAEHVRDIFSGHLEGESKTIPLATAFYPYRDNFMADLENINPVSNRVLAILQDREGDFLNLTRSFNKIDPTFNRTHINASLPPDEIDDIIATLPFGTDYIVADMRNCNQVYETDVGHIGETEVYEADAADWKTFLDSHPVHTQCYNPFRL